MATIEQPALSPTEWRAVAVALQDATLSGTVREPSFWSRLYAALTGNEDRRPLANPRLEAIRAFVADARRTRRVAADRIAALADLGFNRRQIDALILLSA